MGTAFSRMFDRLGGKKEMQIVMFGLDAAGKTTILYKLELGEVETYNPTFGFWGERLTYKHVTFMAWDTHPPWRLYIRHTPGLDLIFVVDSTDRDRADEARDELHKMLQMEKLRDSLLLVFANKQDLPNAMSLDEVTDKLGLHSLRDRQWFIQGCCASKGDGLLDGINWLTTTFQKKE